MARFLPINRDSDYLFPPSVQDWLPETHLARYVANVVESLDLSMIEQAYAGRGSDAYHPASLLIYGYASGVFSSRCIEQATYDSVAFRYLACNRHPEGLRFAQTNGGAGIRHHQVGNGVSAVSIARPHQGSQRMDAGMSGVEFETYGRIAPKFRPECMKDGEERLNSVNSMR